MTSTTTAVRPERARATPLATTAVAIAVLAVVCGLTVVWFFAAIPFGIFAVVCAVVDRRRHHRADDQSQHSTASTVALTLGLAVLPLAASTMLLVPRVEAVATRAAGAMQGGVEKDLESLEHTTTKNVDALNSTLTGLVTITNDRWTDNLKELEHVTTDNMTSLEREMRAIVDEISRTASVELERLEAAVAEDVKIADQRAASIQAQLQEQIEVLLTRLDQLEREARAARAEAHSSSWTTPG
ncbi:MAG: hypothetical protein M3Y51_01165 [Actinomycetota bacterium]|nr:hypothetical protein [Actinomycetota bacterium]